MGLSITTPTFVVPDHQTQLSHEGEGRGAATTGGQLAEAVTQAEAELGEDGAGAVSPKLVRIIREYAKEVALGEGSRVLDGVEVTGLSPKLLKVIGTLVREEVVDVVTAARAKEAAKGKGTLAELRRKLSTCENRKANAAITSALQVQAQSSAKGQSRKGTKKNSRKGKKKAKKPKKAKKLRKATKKVSPNINTTEYRLNTCSISIIVLRS